MNRFALFAATGVVTLVAASILTFRAGAQAPSRSITLRVGDVVRVAGAANIGCKVRQHDRLATLDCRRAGPLRGTYGAMLNKHEVLVVRFANANVAKVVFSGRHENPTFARCH